MKKLMLLGGSRYILPVIRTAHELGIYVITADYLPDNIAHKYSDEYVNVSVVDKEAVLKCALDKKVDGIMSFACDPGVVTAAYVAEQMGLPSVGSYESVSILQDKGKFREFLKENDFNVPKSKIYSCVEEIKTDEQQIDYPVIVKPVDNAGSKGVKKVSSQRELGEAVKNAFDNSRCGKIIIEQYLEPVGNPSDSDWFSVNGKIVYASFNSQLFVRDGVNPYVPAGFYWESTISENSREILKKEIQRLVKLLGLRSSIYNVEVRECTDGNPYIMEFSPRGGGNRLAECIEMGTGERLIEASIKAAIGLEINEIEENKLDKHIAELILHSDRSGIFEGLFISGEILNNIIEKDLWIEVGDHVNDFTGANMSIGTIVLDFTSKDEMKSKMENINNYIKVIVK